MLDEFFIYKTTVANENTFNRESQEHSLKPAFNWEKKNTSSFLDSKRHIFWKMIIVLHLNDNYTILKPNCRFKSFKLALFHILCGNGISPNNQSDLAGVEVTEDYIITTHE